MLGLAGVGTALVLSLGASSPPAYAVTTVGDDSVLVTINQDSALPQANAKLTAMGIHEQVIIYMAAGPAAVSGPVTCTPAPGDDVSGPTLEVLVGNDATSSAAPASLGPMRTGGAPTWRRARVESPGQLAGNTGVGTFHLDHCVVTGDAGEGDSGNTGAG
jgi:hypothetical protein